MAPMLELDQLSSLVAALCDDTIQDREVAELERLLCDSPTARQWYISYLDLHGELCWDHFSGYQRAMGGCRCELADREEGTRGGAQSLAVPIGASLSYAGVAALFSYAMTTALVFAGILVAWNWRPSVPEEAGSLAQSRAPAAYYVADRHGLAASGVVGKLSKIDGCRWTDRGTARKEGSEIRVGDKYDFQSGQLEIMYGMGAKVVLKGPARYEVDSADGGLLLLGVLTAQVPSSERAADAVESNGRESRVAFCVRTPHGVTTNRGGEFRVWVDKAGQDYAYCVRGTVVLQANAADTGILVLRHRKKPGGETYEAQETVRQDRTGSPEEKQGRHDVPGT